MPRPKLETIAPEANSSGQTKPAARINVRATERFAVQQNGLEPFDIKEQFRNIDAHGWSSPRDHYVHSHLTPTEIADLWGLNVKTVSEWVKRCEWDKMRAAYLKVTPVEAGGQLVTVDLEAAKMKFQQQELQDYETLRQALMAEVAETHEEVPSPTGGIVSKRKSASQRKAEISARRELNEGIRLSLGMPTKTTDMFKGANINTGDQILEIVFNSSESASPKALPIPCTEGEIVNGDS